MNVKQVDIKPVYCHWAQVPGSARPSTRSTSIPSPQNTTFLAFFCPIIFFRHCGYTCYLYYPGSVAQRVKRATGWNMSSGWVAHQTKHDDWQEMVICVQSAPYKGSYMYIIGSVIPTLPPKTPNTCLPSVNSLFYVNNVFRALFLANSRKIYWKDLIISYCKLAVKYRAYPCRLGSENVLFSEGKVFMSRSCVFHENEQKDFHNPVHRWSHRSVIWVIPPCFFFKFLYLDWTLSDIHPVFFNIQLHSNMLTLSELFIHQPYCNWV